SQQDCRWSRGDSLTTVTSLPDRKRNDQPALVLSQKEFMKFSQLGLAAAQQSACESLGYTEPTPIQRQAIPVILSGSDLIGCAETGTGKTAAFLLPIIQRITERQLPGARVLVLAPTRELALQIEASYRELALKKSPRCVTVMGGAN